MTPKETLDITAQNAKFCKDSHFQDKHHGTIFLCEKLRPLVRKNP